MYRQGYLSTWRKHKKPRVGQSNSKRAECLSLHWHRSGLEANVCDELRLRKIGKDITDYDVEFKVALTLEDYFLWNHYVDFRTHDTDGGFTFVEAKGIEWPDWKRNWGILQHMFRNDPMVRFRVVK